MDLHQLRLFVAVVEAGSIRGAAKKTFVAQPQLSLIIRRLEREIQVPLLVRSAKGVEPTDCGRELLMQSRALLRDFDCAVERVRSLAKPQREQRALLAC